NDFAIRGIRAVEPSSNPASLARELNRLFQPVAPMLKVLPISQRVQPKNAGGRPFPAATGTISWHYVGYPYPPQKDVYHSERVVTPIQNTDADPVLSKKRIQLEGEVYVALPLQLFVDKDGTLPHTKYRAAATPQSHTEYHWAKDRPTRLAAVAL